jgi:hypothetical protein
MKTAKKALVEITDDDIATIEKMHDRLMDDQGFYCSLLEKSRILTHKMYRAVYDQEKQKR